MPAAAMATEVWSGTLLLARDFAVLHGSAGATSTHAHHAHQLLLSPRAPVTVECGSASQTGHRVLIESAQPHAIVVAPATLFTVFAEPASFTPAVLASLDDNPQSAAELATSLQTLPRRETADPRVAAALDDIDRLLDGKVRAQDVAARVALSLSQLERLFSAHLGASIRRLVRWRRLRLALALALGGATLTAAAHEAGFADSAHFSRVMRSMFGVRADHVLPGLQLRLLG